MANKDIFLIGGSAGSHVALRQIVSELPADFPGSIFVATHVPTNSQGYLADFLSSFSALPVSRAVDGQSFECGHIYAAVPDRHLLLVGGAMRLGEGPRENMTRPAIDPLFRSAALAYGPSAVGIILSGLQNDGASGLTAIKACGGTALVQNPLNAHADPMPLAALEAVIADFVGSPEELGREMIRLVDTDPNEAVPCPDSLLLEVEIAAGTRLGSAVLRQIADPSPLSCPDCQGVLSEVRDERPLRYRCQIGHSYTAEILDSHFDKVSEAMRIALRIMEERVTLVSRMARDARSTGRDAVAELYEGRAVEYGRYATILRDAAVGSLRKPARTAPRQQ